jgi:protein ImuA
MIEELRKTLRALEKPAGIEETAGLLPLGVPAIDGVLGGGLARGALHEIAAAGEAHVGTAAGFALGVACLRGGAGVSSHRPTRPVIPGRPPQPEGLTPASRNDEERAGRGVLAWIAEDMALAESGVPYGPGLESFGLAPERLLTVAAAHTRDLLWAMEEALRCRAVAVVIGELRHGEIDGVAVRRLSLAAAESGALALLLRASPPQDASTAATRWIVSAAPSAPGFRVRGLTSASRNDEEKIGDERTACFAVRLTRNRRGPLGSWILQWSDDDGRFLLATPAQPVAAPAVDRPHRKSA